MPPRPNTMSNSSVCTFRNKVCKVDSHGGTNRAGPSVLMSASKSSSVANMVTKTNSYLYVELLGSFQQALQKMRPENSWST
eukprot:11425779-Ditylum_brightwellii.AAC.1